MPCIAPLLSSLPHLQAIQVAASAKVNEDLFDSTDLVANMCRQHSSTLRRVTFRDTNRWTAASPTTGLLSFCLANAQMVPEQPKDGNRQAESLRKNMLEFPVEYLEEDLPFCFEQYAWTWRSAFRIVPVLS
jgi:hypothetical protein